MSVYTSLLQMSGINPYHSHYNPEALDGWDPEKPFSERYFIVSIPSEFIQDAMYFTDKVNTSYRELTGKDSKYISLTAFIEKLIERGIYELEDLKDELIVEMQNKSEEEQ